MTNTVRATRLLIIAVVLGLSAIVRADAPARDEYANPLDVLIADPFIHREGDTYYLYGTGSRDGFVVWTSHDLVNWTVHDHVFERSDDTWSQMHFWAPELFVNEGKYYLHFTAVGGEEFARRPVLAVGDSPHGPFREMKAPWFDPGHETIDSHVFRDEDGTLYLYAVEIQPRRPFEIHVRTLDPATMQPSEQSTLCITPSQLWEGGWVNEGPIITRRGEKYLMTYSANGFENPNYSVGLAVADSPSGPWEKPLKGPILRRAGHVSGPGHHCFAEAPDGKELFIVYHTHQNRRRPGGARQLAIDRARFIDGPVPSMEVDGPTETPQPMPSGAAPLARGQSDEFEQPQLDRRRWSVFNEDPISWSLRQGRLNIRTHDGDVHEARADASNIFLQYAPHGDFDVTSRVIFRPAQNFEQAFLCLWQDHNHFAKLALVHSDQTRLEIGVERDGRYDSQLQDLPFSLDQDLWLRISRRGEKYDFSASRDGEQWSTVGSRELPLIDLRIGFGAISPVSGRSIPADFDFIRFSQPQ